jgi:hypothetical protein
LSRLLSSLLIVLFAGAAVPAAALAQEPGLPQEDPRKKPAPLPNFTNRTHVRIQQASDQEDPILQRSWNPGFYRQDNGNEVQIDATTLYRMPEHRPEISTPVLSLRVSSLKFASLGGRGIANRVDPPIIPIIVTPPPQPPEPPPERDPIPPGSKPLFVSDSGVSDSDTPLISGPELDFTVLDNLGQWRSLRWLPEGTALQVYGRLQFGTLKLFGRSTSLQMYSVGPRLALPLHRTDSFELDAGVFGGVGFVKTGLGDAVGFDGGAGISAEQKLGGGVSLYAAVDAELFLTKGTSAFGPAFNVGIRMGF